MCFNTATHEVLEVQCNFNWRAPRIKKKPLIDKHSENIIDKFQAYLKMLLIASSGLGIDCSSTFLLTADIISAAVDSGVTSGSKLGKLLINQNIQ